MTTIRDIARESGYSVSTVSRVLNNKHHVSAEARLAIQQVIEQLDYVPNNIARDLSKGRTESIGVVLPHTNHPYFTQILDGILAAAFVTDYRIVLLPSDYDILREQSYLEQLRCKVFDGLIFTSRRIELEIIKNYQKYGPIVCCEKLEDANVLSVYSVREPAYLEAFQWLKKRGKNQGAILLSRSEEISATAKATMKAYRTFYQSEPDEKLVLTGITTYQDGYEAGEKLVYGSFDYIFANSDDDAAGIRQYYLDHDLLLPLIVGQENQLSGKLLKLPTIDHQLPKVGQHAFFLATKQATTTHIAVMSHFIPR